MKRFYKAARAADGGAIVLDGRPVRTPGRAPSGRCPTSRWPRRSRRNGTRRARRSTRATMPLTGLANAAIDRIAPDRGDLRARPRHLWRKRPALLSRREPAAAGRATGRAWDPILAMGAPALRRRLRAWRAASCIAPAARRRWSGSRQAVAARAAFELAGLSPLVTISGSLVIALALAEGAIDLDTAWAGGHARRASGRPSNGARTTRPAARWPPGKGISRPAGAFSACSDDLARRRLGRRYRRRSGCPPARPPRRGPGMNQATMIPAAASVSASATNR